MTATTRFDYSAPALLPLTVKADRDGARLTAGGVSLRFRGALFQVDADRALRNRWTRPAPRPGELATFALELNAMEPTRLHTVTWFAGEWEPAAERVVHATDLQDNFLFLRKDGVSFFLSLDFPFSRITSTGITYPPDETILPGRTYRAHTVTVCACRLSGSHVGTFDRAEIEAASRYVERRFPLRFNRPLHLSACITNRMTDCRENRVFYSMHDNPTLSLNPKLLEEDVRLMAEIGVEYFQIFEGVFDWPEERRTGAALHRLVQLGRRLGVRIGDYVNPQGLYCWHYNYLRRDLAKPEWLIRKADGKPGAYCLGCRDYVASFRDRLLAHNRKHGEELICFDFLDLQPCHATDHGHPPGDLYQQVRNLVSLFTALAELTPNYLVWSNSGNWQQFLPKLAWSNPNLYLTDPHVRAYAPTLNILKFLGDGRREQMVTQHERSFVPYRFYTNCEYYAFPRSRESDLRVFEYSFLQGLAVTPNICPAEVRTFFNRIPAPDRKRCAAFMRKWMDFTRKHFDVWQHTARVGDPPGLGAEEIYAHIAGDHGFVCLVNKNPFPQRVSFRLDRTIGLRHGKRFLLREVYPRECPIAEQSLPWASLGDEIQCRLPCHSVRYLEIKPCAGVQDKPMVYGLPAQIRKTAGGYRLAVRAPQGETIELGLVLPAGEAVTTVAARQSPIVPMYTFPAQAGLVQRQGRTARLQVTAPRERAPRELTRWRISPGEIDAELPRLGQCGFLGARVSGAFSEEYEIQLDIGAQTGSRAAAKPLPFAPCPEEKPCQPIPCADHQTFETEFLLPFIEPVAFGCMPGWNDDVLIELAFDDPGRVKSIAARLNDKPVEVRRYVYPRRQDWHSFYLELTGVANPGTIRLAVDVHWQTSATP